MSTVVIVVFVSLGCFFFLGFCLYALWFFLFKCRKHELVQETDIIRGDEHFKVKEDIVKFPNGPETVVLSMEKDKHFEEEIFKNEKDLGGKHMQGKTGEITATDLEAGESSSNPTYQYVEYKP